MKLLFRLYLITIFLSFFVSYYAYAIDYNFKDLDKPNMSPNEICSNDSGTATNINDYELDIYYGDSSYVYAQYKMWYKDYDYEKNPPSYLVENDNRSGAVNYVYKYEKIDDENAKLYIKYFECTGCKATTDYVTGLNSYGQCDDDEKTLLKSIGNTPDEICSKNGGSVESAKSDYRLFYFNSGTTQKQYLTDYPDLIVYRSGNTKWINKTLYEDSISSLTKHRLFTNVREISKPHNAVSVYLDYTEFRCSCPSDLVDEYGRCLPINCPKPQVEVNGTCSNETLCEDGGASYQGSCDRSCETLGLITDYVDHDGLLYTPMEKRCVSTYDCNKALQQCISKCGNQDNVNTFECNTDLGMVQGCTCKDDNLDDNVTDPDEIDENTPEDKKTNSLLEIIKNESQKSNEHLNNIESLLTDNNEENHVRKEQLDDIDASLNNIESDIGSIKNTLSNGLDDLKQGQSDGNGLLEDIKESNQGILDKIISWFDDFDTNNLVLETDSNLMTNNINTEIDNLPSLEDLDLNSETQSMLDSVTSKYSNALGFSSSYGTRPQNVTVTLFDKEYTIIDFTWLDDYIGAIRSLFLSIAYISGFLLLLRKD